MYRQEISAEEPKEETMEEMMENTQESGVNDVFRSAEQ